MAGQFQTVGVESKLVQYSGMQVGHVVPVLHGMEAQFIGSSVAGATLDSTASEPGSKGSGIVVTPFAVPALRPMMPCRFGPTLFFPPALMV